MKLDNDFIRKWPTNVALPITRAPVLIMTMIALIAGVFMLLMVSEVGSPRSALNGTVPIAPYGQSSGVTETLIPTLIPSETFSDPPSTLAYDEQFGFFPPDASLLFTLGDWIYNVTNRTVHKLNLRGRMLAASFDANHNLLLAYAYGSIVRLYQNEHEIPMNGVGGQLLPAFAADGSALYYVLALPASTVFYIYRYDLKSGITTPVFRTDTDFIATPPLFHPTQHYGIVIVSGIATSSFYMMATPAAAPFLTVPSRITSAAMQPSGTAILFGDNLGKLYSLTLADNSIKVLLDDGIPKYQIAISTDGSRLSYLNLMGKLYILYLDRLGARAITFDNPLPIGDLRWLSH